MGEKLIHEFLEKPHLQFKIKSVVCFENAPFPLLPLQIKLKKDMFDELDILGTHSPLLVLEYPEWPAADLNSSPCGLELIAPLGDPKNMGALIRSALAFGANKVILTKESCHPFLPHSVKASAGAVLDMTLHYAPQAVSELAVTGLNRALDLNGKNLTEISWPKDLRLWVGEEGPGLNLSETQKKKIERLSISTTGVESLNATVSSSIALWEWSKQQNNRKLCLDMKKAPSSRPQD